MTEKMIDFIFIATWLWIFMLTWIIGEQAEQIEKLEDALKERNDEQRRESSNQGKIQE